MQGAIQELRERLDAVEQSRATEENYGIVKFSGSSTVTQDMGLALSSKEKNPAVSGTMAQSISEVKARLGNVYCYEIATDGSDTQFLDFVNTLAGKDFIIRLNERGLLSRVDGYMDGDGGWGVVQKTTYLGTGEKTNFSVSMRSRQNGVWGGWKIITSE